MANRSNTSLPFNVPMCHHVCQQSSINTIHILVVQITLTDHLVVKKSRMTKAVQKYPQAGQRWVTFALGW